MDRLKRLVAASTFAVAAVGAVAVPVTAHATTIHHAGIVRPACPGIIPCTY